MKLNTTKLMVKGGEEDNNIPIESTTTEQPDVLELGSKYKSRRMTGKRNQHAYTKDNAAVLQNE